MNVGIHEMYRYLSDKELDASTKTRLVSIIRGLEIFCEHFDPDAVRSGTFSVREVEDAPTDLFVGNGRLVFHDSFLKEIRLSFEIITLFDIKIHFFFESFFDHHNGFRELLCSYDSCVIENSIYNLLFTICQDLSNDYLSRSIEINKILKTRNYPDKIQGGYRPNSSGFSDRPFGGSAIKQPK